ncbi:LOW QUALITY PROTEIN: C2 calcium-dependent domain-containing protein 4A-like [Carcharodon carcharias]|uniref:LOW QUALITY PROTEIN: C2 calcium-dependent domain-containing protein 4A-like n=1 Tax=Carcharodon carcharias TaxID=13397 RepID=UPI001B7DC5FB|nr:LOW QUALITY PROTEIN: C2 calcium-dependent domain-containing protein 4A-like [Carcharodon carcharias]
MFYVNVLTPDRVPEFFIPPRFTPQRKAGAAQHRAGGEAALRDGRTGGDGTDWDPRSRAALSLPHFPRARTPYGFCRLLESPHTRRKESLFLGQPVAAGTGQRGVHPLPTPLPPTPPPPHPPNPGRQRVCLRLLSVEGLYGRFADCRGVSCCLSLQLDPGKSQKQRSRNPIFNQDFSFFGITGDQLHSKLLKIKVINKASRMKRGSVLGVCQLSLATILPL